MCACNIHTYIRQRLTTFCTQKITPQPPFFPNASHNIDFRATWIYRAFCQCFVTCKNLCEHWNGRSNIQMVIAFWKMKKYTYRVTCTYADCYGNGNGETKSLCLNFCCLIQQWCLKQMVIACKIRHFSEPSAFMAQLVVSKASRRIAEWFLEQRSSVSVVAGYCQPIVYYQKYVKWQFRHFWLDENWMLTSLRMLRLLRMRIST